MKYYTLLEYYRRDVYFYYDHIKNTISHVDILKGSKIDCLENVYYKVDKIDTYIDKYDILSTGIISLVSLKMKILLEKIANSVCNFVPAVIEDKKGNINTNFFVLSLSSIVDCFDMSKSEYEIDDGFEYPDNIRVQSVFFDYNKLGTHHIYETIINPSIIVSEYFIQEVKKQKLRGFKFIKEGNIWDSEFFE